MKITIDMHFFDGKSESFEVNKNKFIVGRSNKADVVVNKEGFSREHCLIEYADEGFFITDLGSTNGVRINNEELPKNVRTAYNSFLPLSIGFAENVILEVIDSSLHTPVAEMSSGISSIEKKKKVIPEREADAKTGEIKQERYARAQKSGKAKKKNQDLGFKIITILVIIMAILFVYYFFMQQEGAGSSAPIQAPSSDGAEFIEF